jgi:hypothetical protein
MFLTFALCNVVWQHTKSCKRTALFWFIMKQVQCSLDLLFFKGLAKMVDEYGETGNPENHFFFFFNEKSRTLSFASWQNFASIENTTFRGLKCVHGHMNISSLQFFSQTNHPAKFMQEMLCRERYLQR